MRRKGREREVELIEGVAENGEDSKFIPHRKRIHSAFDNEKMTLSSVAALLEE